MGTYAQALHGLKVCVIPNPDNDFRPLALRHRTLSAVTALLLAVKLVAASAVALIPVTAELSTITSARIVEFTNAERKQAGQASLAVNSALSSAAQQKAQHMLDNDYFAHISPDGVTPWFWMAKVGYEYDVAGENLAIDFIEAEDVVAAWLASPTHRDNMLQPAYTETGVAVASGEFQGGTSTVVVHMFGRGAGKAAGVSATASPSPAASATPSPTPSPTPIPAPSDTTPPRIPRIALVGSTAVVKMAANLTVEGEPGSTVRVLVNNQLRTSVLVPGSGTVAASVDVSALPEGPLVIRAYALDVASNESEISEALAVTKDTLGPLIDEKALAFALTPAFDSAQVALLLPGADVSVQGQREGWLLIGEATQPISLALTDEFGNETTLSHVSLRPQFLPEASAEELFLPSRAQQFSRRLAVSLAVALVVLLLLSIFIQVRIQRPALIAHASAVIALAFVLFLI